MEAYAEVINASRCRKQYPDIYEISMKNATDPLVSLAENCNLLLRLMEQIIGVSYSKVLGDIAGATYLAEAAAGATKMGVEANLKMLKDKSYVENVERIIDKSFKDSSQIKDKIITTIMK